jgi:surface polysaccharide O-acyltransferase-like enzyme
MRKNISIDSMRILAAFAVVVIHVSSYYINDVIVVNYQSWVFGTVFNSFSRWSVPMFILISGALLINKKSHQNVILFYKNRIKKILIPLVFWSVFFITFSMYITNFFSIKDIVARLFIGETYYHLWYLFLIVGIYAVTPVISLVYANFTQKERIVSIISIFIASAINSVWVRYFGQNQQFFFFKFLPFLGYFMVGKELFTSKLPFNKYIYLMWWFLSSILIATMTGLLKYINFNITTLFYDYLNPLVVIQSISLYIFMIKFTAEIKFTAQLKNTILLLSSLTFGIYIIHPIFIDLVIKNNENLLLHKNAFIVVPLFSIMVFFLSGIVTYIFLKIPFLRKLV